MLDHGWAESRVTGREFKLDWIQGEQFARVNYIEIDYVSSVIGKLRFIDGEIYL